jgi:hypothetical protein
MGCIIFCLPNREGICFFVYYKSEKIGKNESEKLGKGKREVWCIMGKNLKKQ